MTLRQSLQAMKHTGPILLTVITGNVVNLALNYVFVFGHLGFPAMASAGSALASGCARLTMLVMLLVLSRRQLGPMLRPWRPAAFSMQPLLRTLRIGVPIGLQNTVEFATFGGISVLAGWFGADAISGHQVALNLASLMFMVPMGMGSAASVLVGHAIGARDMPHARRIAASALICGAVFMALSAVVLRAIPTEFARLYTNVPGVIAVAASLLPIAGLFQVFDGLQVVAAGVLRGAGDTRAPLLSNIAGFWIIGGAVVGLRGWARGGLGVPDLAGARAAVGARGARERRGRRALGLGGALQPLPECTHDLEHTVRVILPTRGSQLRHLGLGEAAILRVLKHP
jgi:MATE family multidrug resistance protein